MTTETDKRPVGRPTEYTPEIRAVLCQRLAEGRTLRSVCQDDDMPCRRTVTAWLLLDYEKKEDHVAVKDEFLRHYTRAREEQAENIHDETIEIADDSTNDFMEIKDKKGNSRIVLDKEAVMRSRLRVDTRQAWLANTAPRKYGRNINTSIQALDRNGNRADLPGAQAAAVNGYMAEALAAIEKAEAKKNGGT